MTTPRTTPPDTGADDTSIGFDYQYYYFLLMLLRLNNGETIGLEVKDDIHLEVSNNKLILLQLKHTVQINAASAPINLTERDPDMWKTLHNWVQMIQNPAEGRQSIKKQLEWITNTTFVLVSNKQGQSSNNFLSEVIKLKNKTTTIQEFKAYLKDLIDRTSAASTVQGYMNVQYELSDKSLLLFLEHLDFHLSEDDLISKIKQEIKGYMVPEERIDDVYNALNSNLRDNNYLTVKSRKKVEISNTDFYDKYRHCFGNIRKLPVRKFKPMLPDDHMSQVFIRQLIDIGDITVHEHDIIIQFTKLKLLMYNNLNEWIQKNELTDDEKKNFIDKCVSLWQTEFRAAYRITKRELAAGKSIAELTEVIKEAGLRCIDSLRKYTLLIEDQSLDIDISNGQFYLLSDDLLIGWHIDWEKLYKPKPAIT